MLCALDVIQQYDKTITKEQLRLIAIKKLEKGAEVYG